MFSYESALSSTSTVTKMSDNSALALKPSLSAPATAAVPPTLGLPADDFSKHARWF